MKQFLGATIILLFVVVNIVKLETSSEADTEFLIDVDTCKNETGATKEDMMDLLDRVTPTTKVGKCFQACIMEKINIVNGGKLVPAELIKIVEMGNGKLKGKDGKTLNEVVKDIAEGCKTVTDPDKCESSAKIHACLNEAAKKLEFCPNVF